MLLHTAYQKAIAFLLSTQLADGSWHVKTRSYSFCAVCIKWLSAW